MRTTKNLIRLFLVVICTCCSLQVSYAQNLEGYALADSLIKELPKTKSDTAHISIMISISRALYATDPSVAMKYADSAMQFSQRYNWKKGTGLAYLYRARVYRTTSDYVAGLENANRSYETFNSLKWKKGMADASSEIANNYERLGNYSKAIENNFKALGIYEEQGIERNVGLMYNNIGNNYFSLKDYSKAIENYKNSLGFLKKINDKFGIASALDNMASVYEEQGEFKNVNEYNLQAIKLFEEINDKAAMGRVYNNRGNILAEQMNFDSAYYYYKKAIAIAEKLGIKSTISNGYYGIGDIYLNLVKKGSTNYIIPDSLKIGRSTLLAKAFDSYSRSLGLSEKMGDLSLMVNAAKSLSETEALRGNYKNALDFYTRSTLYKDSIFNDESKTKIATLEKERLAEVKDKEIQLLNKENALQTVEANRIYSVLGVIVLAVIIIALIQYRNSKHRQKVNTLLVEQKEKVESTLSELKSTQTQLIQSEKMASLGELTAGIAHEIQNPLNFVNNFSEVNNELIDEMKTELLSGNNKDAIAIAEDIKQNLEKINHHGKRADAIVKGMLQHSRQTTGIKEPTDINALCDEYLRLSYHGLRAKDKDFNATMQTHFDDTIGKINIIPQDIGRVLLNLCNNAFYAVDEKNKQQMENYEPTVSVSTKKAGDKIEIKVADNGNGIPQKIVDKIFQPFFTTKPTGQGTGLGLSLAYDIITKEHNGNIKVESKEGESSTFIIQLPITN
ncbi:hypothetical protein BH10BAC2_BH10BAC2_39150 [soil metagenome]